MSKSAQGKRELNKFLKQRSNNQSSSDDEENEVVIKKVHANRSNVIRSSEDEMSTPDEDQGTIFQIIEKIKIYIIHN